MNACREIELLRAAATGHFSTSAQERRFQIAHLPPLSFFCEQGGSFAEEARPVPLCESLDPTMVVTRSIPMEE